MKPIPEPMEELNKQYWQHCADEKLCFQKCTTCKTWRHIPRPMCAKCNSIEWEWAKATGRGKIFSWTITRVPLHPAFTSQVPYALLIVEMEEGVKMVSGLRNLPPDEIALGLDVEVIFERVAENMALPYFQPAS